MKRAFHRHHSHPRRDLFQFLFRTEFHITGLPPRALAHVDLVLHVASGRQRCVFFSFILARSHLHDFSHGTHAYGWNDYVDFDVDRENPRKGSFLFGARGSLEQLRRLPLRIVLVQIPFLLAFWYLRGSRMVLCLTGMAAAAAVYNWPRYGFKSRPPLEILNQAGYLFVFLLCIWLNGVPPLTWPALLFGALFAMHSHVFGEIMDLEPDRSAGRRTTAVIIGRVPAKLLIAVFLLIETGLLYFFFQDHVLTGFLLASGIWFILDATLLWRSRPYTPGQMRLAMLAWNVVALLTMPWVWWNASLISPR